MDNGVITDVDLRHEGQANILENTTKADFAHASATVLVYLQDLSGYGQAHGLHSPQVLDATASLSTSGDDLKQVGRN